jgi:hypothetical protein
MARTNNSGNKSSLRLSHRVPSTEISARLFHGHPEGKMMLLQALIKEHEKEFGPPRLPDDYLSARNAANEETARQTRYVMQDVIDMLWRDKVAGFERAVLDGDFKWFERQAKAIRSGDTRSVLEKARDRFEAAVARELCFHRGNEDDVTLEPASRRQPGKQFKRKHIGVTAQQILHRFECRKERRTKKGGQASREEILEGRSSTTVEWLIVEGCRFESERRAREAITRIAELLGYELKQPPPKKTLRNG